MSGSVSDFEARVRVALDARARRAVPSDRTAPAVDWATRAASPDRTPRRGDTWWAAAAAALVLLAVVAAVGGASRLAITPAAPTFGSTSTSTAPAPTVAMAPDRGGAPSTVVQLRSGAGVPVPSTWTTSPAPADYPSARADCLGPQASPCAIVVARLDPTGGANVENDRGVDGDPGYCPVGTGRRALDVAATAQLGGRLAEQRTFTWTCPGHTVRLVQYVVPTVPAFVLHSDQLELPEVAAEFDQIVRTAVLPQQSAPLRIYDQGRVQSIVAAGDGYDLALTRYVGGYVNDWIPTTTTTRYHVPASVLVAANGVPWQVLARSQIVLCSDGTRVTRLVIPGG